MSTIISGINHHVLTYEDKTDNITLDLKPISTISGIAHHVSSSSPSRNLHPDHASIQFSNISKFLGKLQEVQDVMQ
jgi:hypothetical protein